MLALDSVKVSAFHTLKGHVTALGFETRMVSAVVVNPQPEEYGGDEEAVNYRGNDEIHYGTGKGVKRACRPLRKKTQTACLLRKNQKRRPRGEDGALFKSGGLG